MSELLESKEQLIGYFESGAKPRDRWRVGSEYEKIVVSADDGRALPFSGSGGVEEIMRRLLDRYGYEPEEENGRLLALRGDGRSITVEPGGQIELSGDQCETIHDAHLEFTAHIEELLTVAEDFDVTLLGLGMQPVSRITEIELLPKARYHIMYPYMQRRGHLGQRMMKQTAGVQSNLDYSDEADAMRKLRVSMGIVPLVYAIFANSPLSDGTLNGYQSYRGHIWTDTDPDRCGILEFVLRDDSSFEAYADWALDVPMYFIIRDHSYIDCTRRGRITFREYMRSGFSGQQATIDDWGNHLTTLFPEVRLKKYIEIRTPDSQPPALMLSLPALLKGLLYDNDCLDAAWDIVKRWSFPERKTLADDACKFGLGARAGRTAFRDLALELLNIASQGLVRQHKLNERGDDESVHLLRLLDQVRSGHTQADLVIERWKGRWNYDVHRMVECCSYQAEASCF